MIARNNNLRPLLTCGLCSEVPLCKIRVVAVRRWRFGCIYKHSIVISLRVFQPFWVCGTLQVFKKICCTPNWLKIDNLAAPYVVNKTNKIINNKIKINNKAVIPKLAAPLTPLCVIMCRVTPIGDHCPK